LKFLIQKSRIFNLLKRSLWRVTRIQLFVTYTLLSHLPKSAFKLKWATIWFYHRLKYPNKENFSKEKLATFGLSVVNKSKAVTHV